MRYNATKELMEHTIEYLLHKENIGATRADIEENVFSSILQEKYNGDKTEKKYKVFTQRVFDKLNEWKIIKKNDNESYEFYKYLQPMRDWVENENAYDSVTLSIAMIDAFYTVYEYSRDKDFINEINKDNEKLGPFTIAWKSHTDNEEEKNLEKEIAKELLLSRNELKEWTENDTNTLKGLCNNCELENKLYHIRHELGKRQETILKKIKELNLNCEHIIYFNHGKAWDENDILELQECIDNLVHKFGRSPSSILSQAQKFFLNERENYEQGFNTTLSEEEIKKHKELQYEEDADKYAEEVKTKSIYEKEGVDSIFDL